MVMKNEFDWNQLENLPFRIERHRIYKFHVIHRCQGPPGILLRGKIQICNGPVLRQVEPHLPPANLFKLLYRKFALLQQQVAGFLLEGIGFEAHGMGTSISFFVFSGNTVVSPARLVKVSDCKAASLKNQFVVTRRPTGLIRKASANFTATCLKLPSVS